MLSSILAALFLAAIPVEWSVDTFRVKPFVYDCYHGETLDLAASMTAYGTPLDLAGKTARLYWATNANATAWWTTNAAVAATGSITNILAATFSGAYDTGANETYGFIGVDGENYRAAFTLRFRPSPGFTPNRLNPPVTVLDFAAVSVLNPESSPFVVKGGEGGVTLAQVTNVAQNVTSNIVPAWARAETPPESMTDNAVVLTNSVLKTKGGTEISASAIGNAATTNYVNEAIASVAAPGDYANVSNRAYAAPVEYTWSSPDEWMLTFIHGGSTSRSTSFTYGGLDGFCIISNEVISTTFSRVSQTKPVTVDETSLVIPNVTNWSVSSGATITSAGLVSSQTDGLYRVTAKATGGTRYGNVILIGDTVIVETNEFHAADVSGSGTKTVNDTALARLNAAAKVGDYTRGGVTYSVYNAQKVYITQVGAGNVKPFAVSAHILASATHYGYRPLGTQTFTDANGNSATVTKKQWIDLKAWALENGWSAAEINAAGVGDISFILCDTSTSVPDGCIPYFMSEVDAVGYYADGCGLQAWQCSQYHEWALPVTLTAWRSATVASSEHSSYYIRDDIRTRLAAMGTQEYLVSGDSGRPYFIIDRLGRTVVLFANTYPYFGADYVKGFDIIKAFVVAHGDTIKEAN